MKSLTAFALVAVAGLVVPTSLWAAGHSAPLVIPAAAFHNDAAQNMNVMLSRVSNWDPSNTGVMASMTTSGNSANVQSDADISIDDALVMLPDYSYYATTCLPFDDTRLLSVRIWYLETVVFADGFERGDTSGWSEVQ